MIRIAALNEEESEESEEEDIATVTKEAQEELSLTRYNEALEMIRDGKNQEAEDLLIDILSTKLIQEVQKSADAIQVPATLPLKYSCLKNVGNLKLKKGDENSALEYYLKAIDLDGTDVTLWYRVGTVAESIEKYTLAATAFFQGLKYSPNHWPCIDHLITLLFALDDYLTCLLFIARALKRDPVFIKGIVIRDEIFKESPCLQELYKDIYPKDPLSMDGSAEEDEMKEIIDEALDIRYKWNEACKEKPISALGISAPLKPTWIALGQELLNLYEYVQSPDTPYSVGVPVDLSLVRDNSLPKRENSIFVISPEKKPPAESETNKAGTQKQPAKKKFHLESWVLGAQRRSARVRTSTTRTTEDVSLGEILRKIIPLSLLPENNKDGVRNCMEDSMDTMDMYKLFERQEGEPAGISARRASTLAEIEERIKNENYFNSDEEKEDVKKFVADNLENYGVMGLICEYINVLSIKQILTWPSELINVFLDLCVIRRKSCPHPNPFLDSNEEIKLDGEISLINAEFFVDNKVVIKKKSIDENEDIIPLRIVEDISHLILISTRYDLFKPDFELRVFWVRAHIAIYKNEAQEAQYCLTQVLDCLNKLPEQKYTVNNLRSYGTITPDVVEKLKSTLENSRSLAGIEQLWEEQRWEELASILESTFQQSDNRDDLSRSVHIEIFVDALVRLENQFPRAFFWLESCLNESFNKYLHASEDEELQQKWGKVIEKLLQGLFYCIEESDIKLIGSMPSPRLSRLVQNLCHIICHQLETPDNIIDMPIETVDPWILLYFILSYEEDKNKCLEDVSSTVSSENSEDEKSAEIPNSLMILFTAHEYLGKRSWCCLNEGALLLHITDEIIPKLRNEEFASFRSKLTPYVEQAIYCLYSFPNKKSKGRYFTEHSVPQLPLNFDRAKQLLEFYRPDEIPEFDSYRVSSITSETESLFKRILTLAPADCNPGSFIDDMKDFIYGAREDIPKPTHQILPAGVTDINYLLADYYFKSNDYTKAIQYYLLDVCHNPDRLDSWAGMALARGSQLETQLNSCESFSEDEFLKQSKATQRCYQRTLKLDKDHGLIWIEYGSFVYMIHSFCSRLLKHDSEKLSIEQFELFEKEKEEMLILAEECFQKANNLWYEMGEDSSQQDERWLHHYMLGKISEKRVKDPIPALNHYQKSAVYLFEKKAQYPNRINYVNPADYSIEALEIHYRIHTCILKYLEENETKPLDKVQEQFFKKVLETEGNGAFMKVRNNDVAAKKRKASVDNSDDSKRHHSDTSEDVKAVMEHLISQVERVEEKAKSPERRASQESSTTVTSSTSSSTGGSSSSSSTSSSDSSDSSDTDEKEVSKKRTYEEMIESCLKALETCGRRFPEHYKSLYRLAHYYFISQSHKNIDRCKEILLGVTGPSHHNLHALFQDRKPSNFFNGVWRIPVNEIDRPGCFAAHMSRCLTLTMDLMREIKEHHMLLDLCLQLKRIPDPDKKYLRDAEREQLSSQAVVLAHQAIRSKLKDLKANDETLPKFMIDIYRCLNKVQKNVPAKESSFSKLLCDAFSIYKFGKIEPNIPVDVAIKFVHQEQAREKALSLSISSNSNSLTSSQGEKPRKERGGMGSRRGRISTSTRTRMPRSVATPIASTAALSITAVTTTPTNTITTATSTPTTTTSSGSSRGGRSKTQPRAPSFPYPYMPNLLTDPSVLTAAMKGAMGPMDVNLAMNLWNAQLMQQMWSGLASSMHSTAALNATAEQIAKDRPNLSVTALPTVPPTKKTKEKSQLPGKLSVPTKAKLKETPPVMGSPTLPLSNKEIPKLIRNDFPLSISPVSRASDILKNIPVSVSSLPTSSSISSSSLSSHTQIAKSSTQSQPEYKTSTVSSSSKSAYPIHNPLLFTKASLKQSGLPSTNVLGRKPSPIPPVISARKSSPIPPAVSSRKLSPIPPTLSTARPSPLTHTSGVSRQSPVPPTTGVKRPCPVPPPSVGIKRNSPNPPVITSRKQSPVPPIITSQKHSPVPPIMAGRHQSPIPPHVIPGRRQSPIPPVSGLPSRIESSALLRQSTTLPSTSRKSSPIPPVFSRISNPPPAHSIANLIHRGPPNVNKPLNYSTPPQAHMNSTLDRIGKDVTITAASPKLPRFQEPPKPQFSFPGLPSSITVTPQRQDTIKSQTRPQQRRPEKNASQQRKPPDDIITLD